jgi:hypothetical protein
MAAAMAAVGSVGGAKADDARAFIAGAPLVMSQ